MTITQERKLTMHVIINTAALVGEEVAITNSAADLIRMGFNPSALPHVDRIKALAAALVSECEAVVEENPGSTAREAALAITHAQTASMFAVSAATAHLAK